MSADEDRYYETDREAAYLARRAEDRAARTADRQQEDADRAYMRAIAARRAQAAQNGGQS